MENDLHFFKNRRRPYFVLKNRRQPQSYTNGRQLVSVSLLLNTFLGLAQLSKILILILYFSGLCYFIVLFIFSSLRLPSRGCLTEPYWGIPIEIEYLMLPFWKPFRHRFLSIFEAAIKIFKLHLENPLS